MPPAPRRDITPYSDIPPGLAKIISKLQTNQRVLYGLLGTAMSGLVSLAIHCLSHGG